MNKTLLRFLAALATDSRLLAEYHANPVRTLANHGLSEADIKRLETAMDTQPGSPGDPIQPSPVTH